MKNYELIEELLNYPLDAEVVTSHTVQDEEGEEHTVDEEPLVYCFHDVIHL